MPQFKKTKKIKTSEQRVVGCFHLWHGSRQGHRENHSVEPSLRPTEVLGQRPPHIPARASHAPSSHSEAAVSMHFGKVFGF